MSLLLGAGGGGGGRERHGESARKQAMQDWVALLSKGLPLGQAPPQSPGSPELGTQPG